MDNYDEILDCIFGIGQIINEKGPSEVNLENLNIKKEYASLVKSGLTHLLNGSQVKNILWSSEIIYYIKNQPNITLQEIQEILLMEELIVLFQNGPVEQLQEMLQRYGSYDLVMKYREWLDRLLESQSI